MIRPSLALALALGLALAAPTPSQAQTSSLWPSETAEVLPQGRWQVGLFAPLRYGLTERVELSAHPLWMVVSPNAQVKVAWQSRGDWALASTHGLSYPTPLLNLLAGEGAFKVSPGDVRYPSLLAFDSYILHTRPLSGAHRLTLRAGGRVVAGADDYEMPESWGWFDWHFVWPRTAAYFSGISLDGGVSFEGPIAGPFRYRAGVDGFLLPGLPGGWALEQGAVVEYVPADWFALQVGYRVSLATFPYGARLSPPMPIADLLFSW